MRIAHWSIWAPNRSGLFHTTKDMIVACREAGIDCGLIDAQDGDAKTDGQFACEEFRFADTADIYMMHLAVPEPYYSDGTPLVIVLHGNPLYSQQTELYGLEEGNPAPFTTILNYFRRSEPTWFLSMWEEEQSAYWEIVAGEHQRHRMWYAPRGIVFGDEWTPEGKARDLEGDPVIVIADQFRLFKDALPTIWGAYHYWQQNPKARIHIFGLPERGHRARDTLERWLTLSGLHRMIGSLNGIVPYLPEVFRGADVVLSTVPGESRVLLESTACGCATVAPWPYSAYKIDRFWEPGRVGQAISVVWERESVTESGLRTDRAEWIREKFDIARTVEGLQALYADVMETV